ncbi:MAG: hypothetical protein R3298_07640 [Gammaproteobacteria bacterium]|nr:hypothetical protein [Gammaproteobacteria bacterium]
MQQRIRGAFRGACALAGLLASVAGCAAPSGDDRARDDGPPLVTCTEPRPQMCTMHYDPVCARVGEGDGAGWRTYPNGCSACSDPGVTAYRPGGACE